MPIYKIEGANGDTWQARWGRKPNGRPYTKNFKKRDEAKKYLGTVGDKPYIPDRDSLTVGQALDQFVLAAKTTGIDGKAVVRPDTAMNYEKAMKPLRELVMPGGTAVAPMKLSKLTKPVSMAIRDQLVLVTTRDSASRAFNLFKWSIFEAIRREQIVGDPVHGVKGIQVETPEDEDEEVEIPQPHQVKAILDAADARAASSDGRTRRAWGRYRMMVKTFVNAGLRPCELRALMRENVLVDRRLIQIRRSADSKGRMHAPKTKAGRRDIVISAEFAQELGQWLATIPAKPTTLVFANGQGKPDCLANLHRTLWRPLLEDAGLVDESGEPFYNLYALRHFFASVLIEMRISETALAKVMGHGSAAFTKKVYGHLFEDEANRDVVRAENFAEIIRSGALCDTNVIRDNVTPMKSVG